MTSATCASRGASHPAQSQYIHALGRGASQPAQSQDIDALGAADRLGRMPLKRKPPEAEAQCAEASLAQRIEKKTWQKKFRESQLAELFELSELWQASMDRVYQEVFMVTVRPSRGLRHLHRSSSPASSCR